MASYYSSVKAYQNRRNWDYTGLRFNSTHEISKVKSLKRTRFHLIDLFNIFFEKCFQSNFKGISSTYDFAAAN